MECFYIFKKDKSRRRRSAPELMTMMGGDDDNSKKNKNHDRALKSAGSAAASSSSSNLQQQKLRGISDLYNESEQKLRVFSVTELQEATSNFNRMLKIGEGGFGAVYKASIITSNYSSSSNSSNNPSAAAAKTIVAVKKLNPHGLQGHKQWVAEVQYLGVLSHPNLVKLLGYCAVDGERGIQRLLVYEYMPNKSLEDHLFSKAMPLIPWITRLNIILGAAQGIAYLHHGLELQVIYRDFKTSNVLLDKDFSAKISDFGLAREGPAGDRTHVSTAPVGTRGYAAPEYVETGHLTIKSDIWSFGVVLYEILTGRRTLERNRPSVEQKLLEWVKQFPASSKRFRMIIDPRLQNQYSLDAARRIAMLADRCLNKDPKNRPSMSEVVEILKQSIEESSQVSCSDVTTQAPSSRTTTNLPASEKAIDTGRLMMPKMTLQPPIGQASC